MGGKGGGSDPVQVQQPTVTPSPYQTQLASMASDIYGSTGPLRSTFINDWMRFLTPTKTLKVGAQPTMIPQYETFAATPSGYMDPSSGIIYGQNAPNIQMVGDQAILKADPNQQYPISSNIGNYQGDQGQFMGIPLQPYGAGTSGGSRLTGYNPQYNESDYTYGKYNPADIPGYLPQYDIARRGLESQYNVAAQNAIANTPRGGAMSDALNKLNLSRAESVGGLPNTISSTLIQDALNKAYGAAFNAPSQAISGLSSANTAYTSTQNAMINAAMQQQALNQSAQNTKGSGLGTLGMGLGTIVGSALGGPAGGALGGKAGSFAGSAASGSVF